MLDFIETLLETLGRVIAICVFCSGIGAAIGLGVLTFRWVTG